MQLLPGAAGIPGGETGHTMQGQGQLTKSSGRWGEQAWLKQLRGVQFKDRGRYLVLEGSGKLPGGGEA